MLRENSTGREKSNQNIFVICMSLCIIPHPTKEYAGKMRKRVFQSIRKQPKKIIYLTADHSGFAKHFFHSWKSKKMKWMDKTTDHLSEHSFYWVEEELKKKYPKLPIHVFTLGTKWLEKKDQILNYLEKQYRRGSLIIGTSDLTHYGKKFNYTPWSDPVQAGKQKEEETLIAALIEPNSNIVQSELARNPHLACGPRVLECVVFLAERLGLYGTVVDYYDSMQGYEIKSNVTEFVSYVGIKYGKKKQNKINKLDQDLALAAIRNAIVFPNRIPLPKWTYWYKMRSGVFVGTKKGGKTNCSRGEYENGKSTAESIVGAARSCVKDAEERWHIPYGTMDDVTYKIEVLESKSKWRTRKARKINIHKNSPFGVYLTFNQKSATYLPGVWKEALGDVQTPEEMLDHLAGKASGVSINKAWRDDETATVQLYKSKKFKTRKKSHT